ncbi:unnamed protein product [Fraxinus pennsylvanica]|uniref:Uncharacterized protein n=1 Tax=Fraxinus pennsylvanica TaxID=56036 RepID=A0AAD2A2S6_9LAMI|nr:unnamed protein product [Fraxinus pennsylvanica]
METQVEGGHPYIPRDLKLPGYVPVLLSQSTILSVYGISSLLVVSFMWILSGNPSITILYYSYVFSGEYDFPQRSIIRKCLDRAPPSPVFDTAAILITII